MTVLELLKAVIELPQPASEVLEKLLAHQIIGGYDLGKDFAAMKNCLLICATETKTTAHIKHYRDSLAEVLGSTVSKAKKAEVESC